MNFIDAIIRVSCTRTGAAAVCQEAKSTTVHGPRENTTAPRSTHEMNLHAA